MAQPDLIPMPFAENATPGTIEPIEATTPTVPQDATWSTGFPQVTMQPLAAGGIPPRGQNFNGVLNALSRHIFHMQGGGQYKWDDAHGPYSIGDVLQSDDGLRAYVSIVNNNTDNFNTNPSAIGTSWLPWGGDAKANSNLSIQAGAGLTGGGTLTQNRTLAVQFGTTAGTVMEGNDSRIAGALQKSANLSDLQDISTSRNNLGLGTAATRDVVTSATDTTAGRVPTVGWMGLGAPRLANDNSATSRFSHYNPNTFPLNYPAGWSSYGSLLAINHGYEGGPAEIIIEHRANARIGFRGRQNDEIRELYHSGNLPIATAAQAQALTNDATVITPKKLGDAMNAHVLGMGQTWQDVTGSRTAGTTYTNTTGRSIAIKIFSLRDVDTQALELAIGQSIVDSAWVGGGTTTTKRVSVGAVVPPGEVYTCTVENGAIERWLELR